MIFRFSLTGSAVAQTAINRCGYATFRDPNTGETSYVRRLGAYFYPRYHLYLQRVEGATAVCSLHLDMKKPTYLKGRAHSGEYDGELITREIARMLAVIRSAAAH